MGNIFEELVREKGREILLWQIEMQNGTLTKEDFKIIDFQSKLTIYCQRKYFQREKSKELCHTNNVYTFI